MKRWAKAREFAASCAVICLFLVTMSDGPWFPYLNFACIGALIALCFGMEAGRRRGARS